MPTASTDSTASKIASRLARLTSASSIMGEPLDRIAVLKPASLKAAQHRGNLGKGSSAR